MHGRQEQYWKTLTTVRNDSTNNNGVGQGQIITRDRTFFGFIDTNFNFGPQDRMYVGSWQDHITITNATNIIATFDLYELEPRVNTGQVTLTTMMADGITQEGGGSGEAPWMPVLTPFDVENITSRWKIVRVRRKKLREGDSCDFTFRGKINKMFNWNWWSQDSGINAYRGYSKAYYIMAWGKMMGNDEGANQYGHVHLYVGFTSKLNFRVLQVSAPAARFQDSTVDLPTTDMWQVVGGSFAHAPLVDTNTAAPDVFTTVVRNA